VIRESPQNTQGRTTPPQTAHRPGPVPPWHRPAHRPDTTPPGTARHIVPMSFGRAGVRYWAGVSSPHLWCGAGVERAGVRSACTVPHIVPTQHPLVPPATSSRPSTPWHRPPHRPDVLREGRCAVLGRCVLREGRCAVLGRCVLTAPAVRRRCREAHVGRCVLPGGRLSPARSPVGCVGRRSRPRGHGPRVLLGASPEGANGVLGGAPLAPSGQHSLRRPVPSPSGA